MARIYRLYFDQDMAQKDLPWETNLSEEDAHHVRHVLRLKAGAPLQILDQTGNRYQAELVASSKRATRIRLFKSLGKQKALGKKLEVVVFQAPPRAGRMDAMVRPLAELGAHVLRPLITEYTVAKGSLKDSKTWEKRLARWQRMAHESAKQSGRCPAMAIGPPLIFSEAISLVHQFDLGFLLSPDPEDHISPQELSLRFSPTTKTMKSPLKLALFVGPEGGVSPKEIQEAKEAGLIPLCINPQVLRSETASAAAMAIFQFMVS